MTLNNETKVNLLYTICSAIESFIVVTAALLTTIVFMNLLITFLVTSIVAIFIILYVVPLTVRYIRYMYPYEW